MPVTVQCNCGLSYELKDEFAGKSVKCPQCGAVKFAPRAPAAADTAFARDRFLLRQKAMAINQKYYVWDEEGKPILFVERPTFLLRSLLAVGGGIATFLAVLFLLISAAVAIGEEYPASGLLAGVSPFFAIGAMLVVIVLLSPKRHVTFYRDDTKRERLLDVLQDSKVQIIFATYTVRDQRNLVMARFKKNYLYNIFRKRWECFAPNGTLICTAMEDSIVLSLLRRVLGPFLGLLRTNFIIVQGAGETVVGEFNRKATLLDRYVLDMAQDPGRKLDRRMMLALGVMLDTGERR